MPQNLQFIFENTKNTEIKATIMYLDLLVQLKQAVSESLFNELVVNACFQSYDRVKEDLIADIECEKELD